MDVLFLSPHYPLEMTRFTRGLAAVGARVWGVGDQPLGALSQDVRRHLSGWLQVPRLLDEDDVVRRVREWLGHRRPDRIETLWEPLVLCAARLREGYGIAGLSPEQALAFRDKGLMKDKAAAGGVRVPRAARARTGEEVLAAAERIGFPVVVKPIAGAGSADTFRVDDLETLRARLPELRGIDEVSVEEFVQGEELTWDAILCEGEVVYESITHYMPKPMIARHTEWISPMQICLRDLDAPLLQPGRRLGRQTLAALGMRTGFAHLEWFLTPSGEAVLGEVGARSGGGRLVDQMNFTSDIDLYKEWARVVCWGRFEASLVRKYNTAAIFKRARGQGRVVARDGLDGFLRKYGAHVCGVELTGIGEPRRDWKQSLLGDGVIFVRHPDYGACLRIAGEAVSGIELRCG
jgi:hypothetical protein